MFVSGGQMLTTKPGGVARMRGDLLVSLLYFPWCPGCIVGALAGQCLQWKAGGGWSGTWLDREELQGR